MTNEKINTLATFLNVEANEIETSSWDDDILTYGQQEYLVLTDEEAEEKAKEEILQSLWAFNTDFIIQHCKNFEKMDIYEIETAEKSLRYAQENCCENANGLVYALIDDIDEFINDAIMADGRGHFLSFYFYDGRENEENNLYIYRVN